MGAFQLVLLTLLDLHGTSSTFELGAAPKIPAYFKIRFKVNVNNNTTKKYTLVAH